MSDQDLIHLGDILNSTEVVVPREAKDSNALSISHRHKAPLPADATDGLAIIPSPDIQTTGIGIGFFIFCP